MKHRDDPKNDRFYRIADRIFFAAVLVLLASAIAIVERSSA